MLVPELGYPFFHSLCPAYKRHAIPYKFKANFEIDLEKLSTQVTDKTTFIYVINPSNPAGSVFSVKHMQ